MLEHFARRLGLSGSDVDDVTQEVLMLAHQSLRDGVYDPAKGRFRSWLYGITRNRVLVALRGRNRRTRVHLGSDENGLDRMQQVEDPHNDDVTREIWRQEWRYAMLDEAMHQLQHSLGENVFQAFVRFAINHEPAEEVAADLGISTSSVYVYKGRVVEAIRQWVSQFDDEDPNHPDRPSCPSHAIMAEDD